MAVEGEEVQGVGEVADEANEPDDVEDLVRAEPVDVVDHDDEALVQPLEHGAQLLVLLETEGAAASAWARLAAPWTAVPAPTGRRRREELPVGGELARDVLEPRLLLPSCLPISAKNELTRASVPENIHGLNWTTMA